MALYSLEYDRSVKGPLYGASGIAEYWILNLRDRQLERYTAPDVAAERAYARLDTFAKVEYFTHELLGEVRVADLLPMAASTDG